MVLGKMKDIAESYLGKKVVNAVVTVRIYLSLKSKGFAKLG